MAISSTIETCSSGISFTPLDYTRNLLNLGPWLLVEPVKVDFKSLLFALVLVIGLLKPDIGRLLSKIRLKPPPVPFPFPLEFLPFPFPLEFPFPFPFPLL